MRNSPTPCLFVGGPLHLQVIEVNLRGCVGYHTDDQKVVYHPFRIQVPGRLVIVFFPATMSSLDVLADLVRLYEWLGPPHARLANPVGVCLGDFW